jgi:hypothetical protein
VIAEHVLAHASQFVCTVDQPSKEPAMNTNEIRILSQFETEIVCGGGGAPRHPKPHKRSGGTTECIKDPGDLAAWSAGGAVAGIAGGPAGILLGALGGFTGSFLSQAHQNCGNRSANHPTAQ